MASLAGARKVGFQGPLSYPLQGWVSLDLMQQESVASSQIGTYIPSAGLSCFLAWLDPTVSWWVLGWGVGLGVNFVGVKAKYDMFILSTLGHRLGPRLRFRVLGSTAAG